MAKTAYPRAALAQAGVTISDASVDAATKALELADEQLRRRGDYGPSPLGAQLPTFETEEVFFHQIDVPANVAVEAGTSAIYGLRRIRVPEETGEEIGFLGADWHLLPSDVDGAATPIGGGTALAWGDTRGMTAAIIIARSLDMVVGGWKGSPIYLPGMEAAAPCLESRRGQPKYLQRRWFPAGKWTDTTPTKYQQFVPVAGMLDRVTQGETLDVALVIRRSQAVAGGAAARKLVGLASVQLVWVKLQTSDKLTPTPRG